MDTIIYIIVGSLTVGGVIGRLTSIKDITLLTKKTDKDKADTDKKLDDIKEDVGGIYSRLGAVERGQAEQGAELRGLSKQIDRVEAMIGRLLP